MVKVENNTTNIANNATNIQANVVAIADNSKRITWKHYKTSQTTLQTSLITLTAINNVNVKVVGIKGDLDGLTKRVDQNEKISM